MLVILLIILLIRWLSRQESVDRRSPTQLRTASGIETAEFQLHDSILFDAVNLLPRTGYDIQIMREDGRSVRELRLSTDRFGHIPETVIWYDIGIVPCPEGNAVAPGTMHLSEYEISDFEYIGKDYILNILKDEKLVREMTFRVSERLIRPTLYAADWRGCPKSGFLIGEEDVWVVGKNFPKGSIIRLWAVQADSEWEEADQLQDMTSQYYGELPPIFELKGGDTSFKRLLWPKGLGSIGSYDIVAEVVTYPFGFYHASSTSEVQNVVSELSYSSFVIQRRQGVAEPLEMDLAGVRQSQFTYRETFLTTENVFVGVDPQVQPSYIDDTARVYIVDDKPDAQWVAGTALQDVTGGYETITVRYVCTNCWPTQAWAAPLTPGKYDVVLDFNENGFYDPVTDAIDSLGEAGFIVCDIRPDTISFNYSGSGAITINDNGSNITAPEYVSAGHVVKPAAFVRNGSYSVKVKFKAASSINSAKVWAVGGLGGLDNSGSAVLVSSPNWEGTFSINNMPNFVGKHLFDWHWKYKDVDGTPSGELDMGKTGEHIVYTVLSTPVAPSSSMSVIPPLTILDYACTWANGATTKEDVITYILDKGFKLHYNWVGNCHRLAGDFDRLVSTQGINASQHKWSIVYSPYDVGDITIQKTKAIDPVGSEVYGIQLWNYHHWAEAEGAQRDPSVGESMTGTWGVYEDDVYTEYYKVNDLGPPLVTGWVPNQPGQESGGDYFSTPTFWSWKGPDY